MYLEYSMPLAKICACYELNPAILDKLMNNSYKNAQVVWFIMLLSPQQQCL